LTLPVDKFFEGLLFVFSNDRAPFFHGQLCRLWPQGAIAPGYDVSVRAFAINGLLEKFDQSFVAGLTVHRLCTLLSMIATCRSLFDARLLAGCVNVCLSFVSAKCLNVKREVLRELNEKEINSVLASLRMLGVGDAFRGKVSKATSAFNISLIKSGYLSKQFAGLHEIRQCVIGDSTRMCQVLAQEGVVECLLQNFHHELVADFVAVLREMLKCGLLGSDQLVKFWAISVHEHSSTMDVFFDAWPSLMPGLSPEQMHSLAAAVLEINLFPDSALVFLGKKALKFTKQQGKVLYKVLSESYATAGRQTQRLLIRAICTNFPASRKLSAQIQEDCIRMIQNQENLEYAFPLVAELFTKFSPTSLRRYFNALISAPTVKVASQLDIVARILRALNTALAEEQFHKLLQMTEQLMADHSEDVTRFYRDISSLWSPHPDMTQLLFATFCRLATITEEVYLFIKSLFHQLNHRLSAFGFFRDLSRCKGKDLIWELLFRSGSRDVAKFLIFLYGHANDASATGAFIDQCFSSLGTAGALIALDELIHSLEDGLNKELLGLSRNLFLSDDDLLFVTLSGDVNTRMKIESGLSWTAFSCRVAHTLGMPRESLVFSEGDRVLNGDERLREGMNITVRRAKRCGGYMPDIQAAFLPSVILSSPEKSIHLLNLLVENHPELSPLALAVLQNLPTIDSEAQQLWREDVDWAALLDMQTPFLLIYRLNTIGNFLQEGRNAWFSHFSRSGGAVILIELLIRWDSPDSSLCKCIKALFSHPEWAEIAAEFHQTDFSGLLAAIFKSIEVRNDKLTSLYLLVLARLGSTEIGAQPPFVELIRKTVFHPNVTVREAARPLIEDMPAESRLPILCDVFDLASSGDCVQFFLLLVAAARTTRQIDLLWDQIAKQLLSRFRSRLRCRLLSDLHIRFLPPPF
jgi:hypothetical protein